jgi:hypothetical protein
MTTKNKKIKYKYSKDGSPDEKLWNDGWRVGYGFKIFGYLFLRYTKLITPQN